MLVTLVLMMLLCSVSLMSPTVAVVLILVVLHWETGSIRMEVVLLVLIIALYPITCFIELGTKVLCFCIDRIVLLKEDISVVNCWGTLSMSTSVSGYELHN